jgi:hypothetical protein
MTKGRHCKRKNNDDCDWIFDGMMFVEGEYEKYDNNQEWLNWVYGAVVSVILFAVILSSIWGGLIFG